MKLNWTDLDLLSFQVMGMYGDQGRTLPRLGQQGEFDEGEDGEDGTDQFEDDDDKDVEPNYSQSNGLADDDNSNAEEVAFAESDSDMGGDEEEEHLENGLQWKESLMDLANEEFARRRATGALAKLNNFLYGSESVSHLASVFREELGFSADVQESAPRKIQFAEHHDGDEYFRKASAKHIDDLRDGSNPSVKLASLDNWQDDDRLESVKRFFITSDLLEAEEGDEGDENGDFEDLETEDGPDIPAVNPAADFESERTVNARKKEEMRLRFEEVETANSNPLNAELEGDEKETWHEEQKRLRTVQFEINRQKMQELDDSTRGKVEGYGSGEYVRIVLSGVSCEFSQTFDPRWPLIVGGLLSTEEAFGFLRVRIKKHRWHKRTLKNNDPLVFNIGWRRFQSIPLYSTSDSRTRNRMLKYTPEHMHCFATFYGPLVPSNTGFCAVQTVAKSSAGPAFRVAATGVVLDVDQSAHIVKKLKLTGVPTKIFKNTAFIKGMFNSPIEVAKFEGASIKTVSGIRGQVKKALQDPPGSFRATFEDKIALGGISCYLWLF